MRSAAASAAGVMSSTARCATARIMRGRGSRVMGRRLAGCPSAVSRSSTVWRRRTVSRRRRGIGAATRGVGRSAAGVACRTSTVRGAATGIRRSAIRGSCMVRVSGWGLRCLRRGHPGILRGFLRLGFVLLAAVLLTRLLLVMWSGRSRRRVVLRRSCLVLRRTCTRGVGRVVAYRVRGCRGSASGIRRLRHSMLRGRLGRIRRVCRLVYRGCALRWARYIVRCRRAGSGIGIMYAQRRRRRRCVMCFRYRIGLPGGRSGLRHDWPVECGARRQASGARRLATQDSLLGWRNVDAPQDLSLTQFGFRYDGSNLGDVLA